MTDGTPKTLDEAIQNGIETGDVRAAVRDFIAQKVNVAMLEFPQCETALLTCFAHIVAPKRSIADEGVTSK